MSWVTFTQSMEWSMASQTIRDRMALIQSDLLDPEKTKTLQDVAAFQAEYRTCAFFLELPKILQEKIDEEVNSNPS